jgi:hypothetical protein
MPARIVVEEGPDKGRTFVISDRATEVRLGRGPGVTISFSDPSWQGTIRITPRKAGYVVTNDMAGTIYLGDGELARGGERTWYHGETLQPTADTVLVLQIHRAESAAGPAAKSVQETSAPADTQKARRLTYIAILIILAPIAVVAVLSPAEESDDPLSPVEVRRQLFGVEKRLVEARNNPEVEALVRRILVDLREARFLEAWNRQGEAFVHYEKVRDELEAFLGQARATPLPPETEAALLQARSFVSRRLLDLAGRRSSR